MRAKQLLGSSVRYSLGTLRLDADGITAPDGLPAGLACQTCLGATCVDSQLPDLKVGQAVAIAVGVHILSVAVAMGFGAVALSLVFGIPKADGTRVNRGRVEGGRGEDGHRNEALTLKVDRICSAPGLISTVTGSAPGASSYAPISQRAALVYTRHQSHACTYSLHLPQS